MNIGDKDKNEGIGDQFSPSEEISMEDVLGRSSGRIPMVEIRGHLLTQDEAAEVAGKDETWWASVEKPAYLDQPEHLLPEGLTREQANEFFRKRAAHLAAKYQVEILADRLDRIKPRSAVTTGTLELNGQRASWYLGRWHRAIDWTPLFINDSAAWKARPDSRDIHDAVLGALQERNHPDHCDCSSCEIRHRQDVKEICQVLTMQGLQVGEAHPITPTADDERRSDWSVK